MTTERILPAISLPVPGVRAQRELPVPRPSTRGAHTGAARREAVLSTPTRAAMLIGGSVAVYAVTLAGVSVLQADTDAALAAQRAPYADALAAAVQANDSLEGVLLEVDAQTRALADDYAAVGGDVTSFQARLDGLAALVAEVQGSAAALPTRISLPSVSIRGAIAGSGGRAAPPTTAKAGASGAP